MKTLGIAVFSIALSVMAQFFLKSGMSSDRSKQAMASGLSLSGLIDLFSNWHVLIGFGLYGFGAIAWLLVLAKWDVSKAYPLVGLGFLFSLVIGHFLGEEVTLARVAGVTCICVGVVLVGRS
ncbi:hypothetical protein [Aquabacterium sp. UBA2148]|uniref:hypothetical protein n=1 Tax=Aquabacterium sp. UBA2148 TaxID=1946042 RepID=UPI00257DCAB2|nr:hypothetical protein [Aquabacterium sp. UBA2148]